MTLCSVPQGRSSQQPCREVLFTHFSDEESKAWGGKVLHPGHRRVGRQAETALQIIPTLKLLPGPFSGRDSRQNVSQKKGRKEHVLGSNKGPEPHPWAAPRPAMKAGITRLVPCARSFSGWADTGFDASGRALSEAQGAEWTEGGALQPFQAARLACAGRGHVQQAPPAPGQAGGKGRMF